MSQPARIGSNSRDVILMGVGQLTQQRLYTSDVSPAAAVQQSSPSSSPTLIQTSLSASPGASNPAEPAHNAPQVCVPPLLTGRCRYGCELLYHAARLCDCTACEAALAAYRLPTVKSESDVNMALAAAVASCQNWASVAVCQQIASWFACHAGDCCR